MEGEATSVQQADETLGPGGRDRAFQQIRNRGIRKEFTPYTELEQSEITNYERTEVGVFNTISTQLSDRSDSGLIPQSLVDEKPHYEDFARIYQGLIGGLTPNDLAEGYHSTSWRGAKKTNGISFGAGFHSDQRLAALNLRLPIIKPTHGFHNPNHKQDIEFRFYPDRKSLEAKKISIADGNYEPVEREEAIQAPTAYLNPPEREPDRWGTEL